MTDTERGNLCPECDGDGRICGELTFWGNYYEPPEYEELACPVCDGEGTIVAPVEEADAA